MGGAHSRRKPGSGSGSSVASVARMTFGANIPPPKTGYFILSLKRDKIKVVNAEAGLLRLLATIIRRHTRILSEGWERHMTWAIQLGIRSILETRIGSSLTLLLLLIILGQCRHQLKLRMSMVII